MAASRRNSQGVSGAPGHPALEADPGWWNLPSLTGSRVLVTGGAGFVGAHLTRILLACGAQVTVADVAEDPWRLSDLRGQFHYEQVDLAERQAATRCLTAVEPRYVFHLAAYGVQPSQRDWWEALRCNVAGALAVVEASVEAGVERMVQVGTAHEYGGGEEPLAEDRALNPVGVYGATKAAAMVVGRARARELGLAWTGVRPFVAFGPQEAEGKLVPYVFLRALKGLPIETTSGEQVRDFIYVKDLVAGMVHAAVAPDTIDQIVNLAAGNVMPLAELIRRAAALVPGADLRLGARPHRSDHIPRQEADLSKVARLLPEWRPRYDLETALRETLSWYESALAGGSDYSEESEAAQ